MGAEDIQLELGRDPFQPFRLHLSNGLFFDVRKPNMVAVGRRSATIGLRMDGDKQRYAVVALVHIVWLEVLLPSP
jgi:hypothetical protein